ncbi:LIN54 isoform 3 [Pan troglodytes]|uniref:Lin-54 DREAM MuvB core complex component n=3 Tax=Hominidae TaxID=9604 RepID=D6REW4_HUMAN|nr:lin-54 DREAM MuvB core complex component [Homo sapiens]KAI4025989.1 lin-54 DREAM MuvB core complex component [Homo sapiens]PNI83049.1 LIN54 isoform 3 [Pan troglodytes]PNJ52436.1 LIN54 isoform 3 [Pongo abelii]
MEVVPAEIAKKPRTPTSGPVITKLIFAKPINSKAVTGQTTQVSPPVIAGFFHSLLPELHQRP